MHRRLMTTVLVTTTSLILAAAAAAEDDNSEKDEKVKKLATATIKVNRLIGGLTAEGVAVREAITESQLLSGEFTAIINLERIEKTESGDYVVHGTMRVRRGPSERYRTEEERKRVAEAAAGLAGLKEEKETRIRKKQEGWAAYDEMLGHEPPPATCSLRRRTLLNLEREYALKIEEGRQSLRNVAAEVKKSETARKEACESVRVTCGVKHDSEGIRPLKLLEKKTLRAIVKVSDYRTSHESEELGGKQYVCQYMLTGVKFMK